MTSSIGQLKVVQTKYVEAKDSLNVLNKSNEGELITQLCLDYTVLYVNNITWVVRKISLQLMLSYSTAVSVLRRNLSYM